MARNPRQPSQSQAEGPAASTRPLQPSQGHAPQLDAEDGTTNLDEFDDLEEAEHLRRLTEDQNLLTTLQLHGLQGPTWERFADVLARYGYQVIRAWVWTRQIFPHCAQRGFGLPQPDHLRWTKEQADEVASETVAMAIRSFRDYVLREGRWSPTLGATLKTYFVGQCLLQFPNVYRRWLSELELNHQEVPVFEELDDPVDRGEFGDPAGYVVMQDLVDRALASVSNKRTRTVLWLRAAGYSEPEIADLMGTTGKAVELLLYRHRQCGASEEAVDGAA
jgi:DNA-directed RNA polymerase specialized sigma24 family protein